MHSLLQDNHIEVQHDFLDNVTSLAPALASHDADSIVNGIIIFLMSRKFKPGAASLSS